MYKSQLDSMLQRKSPRAALLYGDSFYTQHYSHIIATTLKSEEKHSFYFDEYDMKAVNALLSQSSLFGTQSLIVIKTQAKLPKSDIDIFLESLSHNPHNALIIEYYQASSKSDADYARDCKTLAGYFKHTNLKDEIVEVRFYPPNMGECMQLMRARSKELQLMADDKILNSILALQNYDIALSLKELEKFLIYTGKNAKAIEPSDVNLLCDGIASFSIEELCIHLMEKRYLPTIMNTIYEEGINEIMMIGEIQRFFYQLFLFFAFIKLKGYPDPKAILGYTPPTHKSEQLARYCIRFKEAEYIQIFELLSQWRYEVSTGKTRHSMMALIKIQALIR